jgi:acetyl-CoA carboxylase biotin carboxyl carrier protein
MANKFDDLKEVIKIFESSQLTCMEVEVEGLKVKLDRRDNQSQIISTVSEKKTQKMDIEVKDEHSKENLDLDSYITSPLVGTFHQAPSENADPFVRVGSKVKRGDKLCIIEAMKVMNEITSDKDGIIEKVLVKEGQMVEYGQNLFVIGD